MHHRRQGVRLALKSWAGLWVFALGAAAQPVILYGPLVDSATYSSARVTWVTDVPATTVIHYGRTASYGATTTPGVKVTLHSWYLSGLAPATTYHFKVCSAVDNLERCSADQIITTASAPGSIPAPPEPPRRWVDTSLPAGSYGEPFRVEADCANLPSILGTLAILEGELNYEVLIPAGAVCAGQFVFPARPKHRGWILVKSTQEAQLPAGVRVSEGSTAYMATLRSDALPGVRAALSSLPDACSPGELWWATATPGLPLFVCQPQGSSGGAKPITNATWSGTDPVVITVGNHGYQTGNVVNIRGTGLPVDGLTWRITALDAHNFSLDGSRGGRTYSGGGTATRNDAWTQVPHKSGVELPTSCVPNEWFFKTDVTPQERAAFWCTAPGQWTNVRAIHISAFEHYAAIQFTENASRYRFMALEITHIPTPDPPPPGWDKLDYRQGAFGSLVATQPSNDSIIFDRCDIHGRDYPSRLRYGLYLDGSNVALINSRVHKINQWTQRSDGSLMEACALNIGKGPGPGKIDNNLLEAIGITVFFPDNLAHAAPQADYEIRRNHFSRPDKYLYGSPANTSGKNYMNRYMLELKAGQRMVVEGNLFDGNWADSDHGAMIVLTPRSTTYLPPKTLTSVENGIVKVSSPQDPYLPGMLVLIGETGSANHNGLWEIAEVLDPTTFKLKNPPTGKGTGGRVIAASCNMQISDIDIRNNIFRRGPNVMVLSGHHETGSAPLTTKTTQRIRLANNLVYGMDARAAVDGGRVSPIGGYADGRPGVFLYLGFGMEDLIIRNNTIIDYRGLAPTFMAFDSITVGAHAGLEALYNIFTASPAYLIRFGVLYFGVEILNLEWTRHPDPWWVMSTNVFCCELPQAMETRKPPGNAYLDSETRLGLDVNFCLRLDSPLKGLIAGRDPGIDYDELYAALPDALRAEFPIYSPRRRAAQAERPQPRGSR